MTIDNKNQANPNKERIFLTLNNGIIEDFKSVGHISGNIYFTFCYSRDDHGRYVANSYPSDKNGISDKNPHERDAGWKKTTIDEVSFITAAKLVLSEHGKRNQIEYISIYIKDRKNETFLNEGIPAGIQTLKTILETRYQRITDIPAKNITAETIAEHIKGNNPDIIFS